MLGVASAAATILFVRRVEEEEEEGWPELAPPAEAILRSDRMGGIGDS